MIVGNCLISDDIAEIKFNCDCYKCFGKCCVEGDAGAPLTDDEIQILNRKIDLIKPFIGSEAIEIIESTGLFVLDPEGIKVTPLMPDKECVFTVFENGIAMCAIEKAFENKKIDFQKPISCHLYPIRLENYEDFIAVNYHNWSICKTALHNGKANNIYLFEFLKNPLIRKFGEEWYKELLVTIEYKNRHNT